MATRSYIGIKNEDSTVDYIYCHFDGYPEGVGKQLITYYDTESKVRQLMIMGDCSSLQSTLKDSDFYHRDRNDSLEDTQVKISKNCKEFLDNNKAGVEFWYIFADGEWQCFEQDDDSTTKRREIILYE